MFNDIELISKEIKEAISDLKLDLTGLTVLTEAGSDFYNLPCLIALKAGAKKVYALGADSKYGKFIDIKKQILSTAKKMQIKTSNLQMLTKEDFADYSSIDIVMNLGYVRPINKQFLAKLKSEAVVSFMMEKWENRGDDVDLKAAKELHIPVFGINEDHPAVNSFREVGALALKLIFETKISIYDAKIAVLSSDAFGKYIIKDLKKFTSKAKVVNTFKPSDNWDLVLVADLFGNPKIPDKFRTVVLCSNGRMTHTLADISYKAGIRLSTGGLKVGEIAFKKKLSKKPFSDLAQRMI